MSGRPGYPAMFERGGPPSLYPAAPQFSAVAPPPAPPRRTAAPATGICFKDGEVFWKPFAQLPDWLTNNNQVVVCLYWTDQMRFILLTFILRERIAYIRLP